MQDSILITEYGSPSLSWFFSAHPEWGSLHYFFSDWVRLWTMIGATQIDFASRQAVDQWLRDIGLA